MTRDADSMRRSKQMQRQIHTSIRWSSFQNFLRSITSAFGATYEVEPVSSLLVLECLLSTVQRS
jgi:hypothetical protein